MDSDNGQESAETKYLKELVETKRQERADEDRRTCCFLVGCGLWPVLVLLLYFAGKIKEFFHW